LGRAWIHLHLIPFALFSLTQTFRLLADSSRATFEFLGRPRPFAPWYFFSSKFHPFHPSCLHNSRIRATPRYTLFRCSSQSRRSFQVFRSSCMRTLSPVARPGRSFLPSISMTVENPGIFPTFDPLITDIRTAFRLFPLESSPSMLLLLEES